MILELGPSREVNLSLSYMLEKATAHDSSVVDLNPSLEHIQHAALSLMSDMTCPIIISAPLDFSGPAYGSFIFTFNMKPPLLTGLVGQQRALRQFEDGTLPAFLTVSGVSLVVNLCQLDCIYPCVSRAKRYLIAYDILSNTNPTCGASSSFVNEMAHPSGYGQVTQANAVRALLLLTGPVIRLAIARRPPPQITNCIPAMVATNTSASTRFTISGGLAHSGASASPLPSGSSSSSNGDDSFTTPSMDRYTFRSTTSILPLSVSEGAEGAEGIEPLPRTILNMLRSDLQVAIDAALSVLPNSDSRRDFINNATTVLLKSVVIAAVDIEDRSTSSQFPINITDAESTK